MDYSQSPLNERMIRNRMSDRGRITERYISQRCGFAVGEAIDKLVELIRGGDTTSLRWYLSIVFGAEPVRSRQQPRGDSHDNVKPIGEFEGRPEYELREAQ